MLLPEQIVQINADTLSSSSLLPDVLDFKCGTEALLVSLKTLTIIFIIRDNSTENRNCIHFE
jgi:hypothetical protein